MNDPGSIANRPLAASLHHIAIGSPDPAGLADFHQRVMGLSLRGESEGLLGEAEGRRIFFVAGEARTLVFAGFALDDDQDLAALKARLDAAHWAYDLLQDGTTLLAPGAIEVRDPDGNRLFFGRPRASQAVSGSTLPARLQHIVLASRHAARLSAFYQQTLGFLLSDNVVDEHEELRTAFLRCGAEHHSFAVFQAATDRFDHHCCEAGDWGLIRDWGDHFAQHDVKIAWGPGRHGPGNNLFLFVHDPDDNWLEISAELEVVVPGRPVGIWPHAQRTLNLWGSAPLRS